MIDKEKLYRAAHEFKKEKLWNYLTDEQLFAVQHEDGTISYCSVLGRLGKQYALNVYTGPSGMASYRRLIEIAKEDMQFDGEDPFLLGEMTNAQECVCCIFENKDILEEEEKKENKKYAKRLGVDLRLPNMYVVLQKLTPGLFPHYIDTEKDAAILLDALEAATFFSRQLHEGKIRLRDISPQSIASSVFLLTRKDGKWEVGKTVLPNKKYSYPAPEFSNEVILKKIKKLKKSETWQMGLFYAPVYIGDDGENRKNGSFFPLVLMAVTEETRVLRIAHIESEHQEDPQEFFADLAKEILQNGSCPEVIRCREDRCYHFLKDFCSKSGIEIDREGDTSLLFEIEQEFCDHLVNTASSPDGGLPEEMLEELFGDMSQMSDKDLLNLPRDIKEALKEICSQNILPPELARRVKRLF